MAECYNVACPYCVDYQCRRTCTCDMRLDGEYVKVEHGQKSKTITNADNLRSISNMQLAIFMDSVNACPYDRDDALFECEKWNGACDRCWLYWLTQKVEDEVKE